MKINQYSQFFGEGDGISRGIILIKQMLNELKYESDIYISQKHSSISLNNYYHCLDDFKDDSSNILIYHFSIGNKFHEQIMNTKDKKIIVYHNITPAHFFDSAVFKDRCNLGRKQLKESSDKFIAAISDSSYNEKELLLYGYKNSFVLPLLVDSRKKPDIKINHKIIKKHSSTFNILFVGRIIQNKAQHQLIDVIYELKKRNITNIKLFIVGKNYYSDYFNFLFQYSKNLGLEKNVIITGAVNENDLYSYYKIANLYLSLSEHEGFGMPILEAINQKIPVLSYACGSIPTTLGKKGLINFKAADKVSKKVKKVMFDKKYRDDLVKKQHKHLKNFEYNHLKKSLKNFLDKII